MARPAQSRRALIAYLLTAFGVTWLVWWPYVRAAQTGGAPPSPYLYYLAAFGPLAGAFLAAAIEHGRAGARALAMRLLQGPARWLLIGIASPLALVPLAAMLVVLAGQGWPDWSALGSSGRAPGLGPFALWLLMTLSYGFGEETGWRGYLLPRLQARYSALGATLLLTVIWAVWHAPAFLFREGYTTLGVTGMIGFLIGLLAGAVVLTWLFNSSRGSVLVVALWHGSWNWVATADGLQGPWVAVMSSLIMVAAVVIVFRYRPAELCAGQRCRAQNY